MSHPALRLVLSAALGAAVLAIGSAGTAVADHDKGVIYLKGSRPGWLAGMTRGYRKKAGLPVPALSLALTNAAGQYAQFLASSNKDGHTADGRKPEERVAAQGFAYCFTAENVYSHWSTVPITAEQAARAAINWWKNSPGHNANMLNPNSNHVGVGLATAIHNGQHIWKAVQVFAAPPGTCQ
jgi:uncharacterized protein YkwD